VALRGEQCVGLGVRGRGSALGCAGKASRRQPWPSSLENDPRAQGRRSHSGQQSRRRGEVGAMGTSCRGTDEAPRWCGRKKRKVRWGKIVAD
jgi:hypothetical protein